MQGTVKVTFLNNQGSSRWLDGDTTKGQVRLQPGIMTFAAQSGCNYTGTAWWIRPLGQGSKVHIICMGSDNPNHFYLDGLTATGEVKLTPDANTGTFWTFEQKSHGYLIRCMGTGPGDHRLLQVLDYRVKLCIESTPPYDDTVIWTAYALNPVWPV
jgi:hypothetical protein